MKSIPTERDVVIDALKGIGIILMIYGHTISIPMIGRWIYIFHMPLFFFLSGCFYRKEYDARKGLDNLLIPYFIFLFIFLATTLAVSCIISILNSFDLFQVVIYKMQFFMQDLTASLCGDEKTIFFKSLWFLPVIFMVQFIYNKLQSLLSNIKLHFTMLLFWVISSFLYSYNIDLPYFIDTLLCVIPYYHCGRIFYKNKDRYLAKLRQYCYLLLLSPIMLLMFFDGEYSVDYKYNIVPWYNHIVAIMTIVGGYVFMCKFKKLPNFILNIGRMSIFYFGLHRTIFLWLLPILNKTHLNVYIQSIVLWLMTILILSIILILFGNKKKWLLGQLKN